MVFHLVVNEVPTAPIISTRHPIMAGLRNCLRTASRHSIALLTLPLLLMDKLGPVGVGVGVVGRVGAWLCLWGNWWKRVRVRECGVCVHVWQEGESGREYVSILVCA